MIKEIGENRTVIVSSHILSEISAICDRVLIINKGKILAEDTPDNLSKKPENQSRFTARIEGEKNAVESELKNIPGIVSYTYSWVNEENTSDYVIVAASGTDIRKPLFKALAEKDMALLMMNPVELSLEEILNKYNRLSSHIKYKVNDANKNPGFMTKYTKDASQLSSFSVVFECGNKFKIVDLAENVSYMSNDGQYIDLPNAEKSLPLQFFMW